MLKKQVQELQHRSPSHELAFSTLVGSPLAVNQSPVRLRQCPTNNRHNVPKLSQRQQATAPFSPHDILLHELSLQTTDHYIIATQRAQSAW